MLEITRLTPLPSLSPVDHERARCLRVGLVQHRWNQDAAVLKAELAEGIARAAGLGASVVFLPELTLSRYPADSYPDTDLPVEQAEDLRSGPTLEFAAEQARKNGVSVHASLYQKVNDGDGLGLNTAILVGADGELLGATNKLHIPVSAGYYEDHYFRAGPAEGNPYPVYQLTGSGGAESAALGMPTCWDEWFPELARIYSLAGAELLVYPTAIGSEPTYPGFDTQPLWQQVIVGNGIANGLFMAVPNRWGDEGSVNFYGSSFISDPYGRILVQAPRAESAVLVAELDLNQRKDWLTLFPFHETRRPDTYSPLLAPAPARSGAHS